MRAASSARSWSSGLSNMPTISGLPTSPPTSAPPSGAESDMGLREAGSLRGELALLIAEQRLGKYTSERIADAAIAVILARLREPSEGMQMAAHQSTARWLNFDRQGSGLTQALMKHKVRWHAMLAAWQKEQL